MLTSTANSGSRLSLWLRVREFAVPPSMIETATARRHLGDWAGACAAANIDVDLDLRAVARTHGRDLAARIRADLRRLAPDLLRWHLPRIAPDGLLRPGLTVALARYDTSERDDGHPVQLVARTPPAWADAGQRISLALWDASHREAGAARYPHPHPDRRFRLDLHRHLWDAHRSGELRRRSGADRHPSTGPDPLGAVPAAVLPPERRCAVDRWAAEAEILLTAEGRSTGPVGVRLGARHRLILEPAADRDGPGSPARRIVVAPTGGGDPALPVLPDAATWTLPTSNCSAAGRSRPTGCIRWSPRPWSRAGCRPDPPRSWSGPGSRARWTAAVPGTGSAWSTACWRRWTTTRPRSAGRSCWSH